MQTHLLDLPDEMLLAITSYLKEDLCIMPFVCVRFWKLLRHKNTKPSLRAYLQTQPLWEFALKTYQFKQHRLATDDHDLPSRDK